MELGFPVVALTSYFVLRNSSSSFVVVIRRRPRIDDDDDEQEHEYEYDHEYDDDDELRSTSYEGPAEESRLAESRVRHNFLDKDRQIANNITASL